MSTDAVTLLLAFLAVLAQATVAAVLVLSVAGRRLPSVARLGGSMRRFLGPQASSLAVLVAVVATSGSLYFSEIAHFTPCRLCWYQRFVMYPLVPILMMVARRRSRVLQRVAMVIPLLGASVSGYHMAVERFPSLESTTCDPTNPCSLIWVERFGYLTIPTMALSAFLLIATLLWVADPAPIDPPSDDPLVVLKGTVS